MDRGKRQMVAYGQEVEEEEEEIPSLLNSKQTPKDIFKEIRQRRAGVVKALTTDYDKFISQWDQSEKNLALYGLPDRKWVVEPPPEHVPTELPEPSFGLHLSDINFGSEAWLRLVADHSASWLVALAYFYSNQFGYLKDRRITLSKLLLTLTPLAEEVVRARKFVGFAITEKNGHLCGLCGLREVGDRIQCDSCRRWFHYDCARVTAKMVQKGMEPFCCRACGKQQKSHS